MVSYDARRRLETGYAAAMEVRKDFESAAPYLYRLWGIGQSFRKFCIEDWSHLKNKEDFDRVYRLDQPLRSTFEGLYGDGRDIAHYMMDHLCNFNAVALFPTLTAYVQSFDTNWCSVADMADLRRRAQSYETHIYSPEVPWAVREMIKLWKQQVGLLGTVVSTVSLLRQTDIYRVENGEMKVSDFGKAQMNIGVVGNVTNSKINVASSDSSTTVTITAHPVFSELRQAIQAASIPATEKGVLNQHVDAMEAEVGKPAFTKRYTDFIAAAANHMTLLAPLIPALTSVIG